MLICLSRFVVVVVVVVVVFFPSQSLWSLKIQLAEILSHPLLIKGTNLSALTVGG